MKYFITLITTLLISFNAYCSDPTTVYFCANTTNIITLTDLLNCNELTVNDATYNIQSLKLGFEANGSYYEQIITGNTIPQTFIDYIQSYSPVKIYMENIILTDSNNQTKNLKPLTFKVTN